MGTDQRVQLAQHAHQRRARPRGHQLPLHSLEIHLQASTGRSTRRPSPRSTRPSGDQGRLRRRPAAGVGRAASLRAAHGLEDARRRGRPARRIGIVINGSPLFHRRRGLPARATSTGWCGRSSRRGDHGPSDPIFSTTPASRPASTILSRPKAHRARGHGPAGSTPAAKRFLARDPEITGSKRREITNKARAEIMPHL